MISLLQLLPLQLILLLVLLLLRLVVLVIVLLIMLVVLVYVGAVCRALFLDPIIVGSNAVGWVRAVTFLVK